MALQKGIDIDVLFVNKTLQLDNIVPAEIINNYTINNSYIKIININGNKDRIYLQVGFFTEDNSTLVTSKTYSFTPVINNGSSNFIQQGYEYLKTLQEFEGAIDI